jgi:5-methylcytosine-specific restriction endonuclease McrA
MAGGSDDVVRRHCQTMRHVQWGPLMGHIAIVVSSQWVSIRCDVYQVDVLHCLCCVESMWPVLLCW